MTHVHVLLKKEEIEPEKLVGSIVIVLDVLLATTTISYAFAYGAKEVIPVSCEKDALHLSTYYHPDEFVLVGEHEGRVIDGFLSPSPSLLKPYVRDKVVILATTNGTVALNRSEQADAVYPACLRNGEAVIDDVLSRLKRGQNIVIVCAGSSGQFCLEDFYGAGYLLRLLRSGLSSLSLNDAGIAAQLHFLAEQNNGYDLLAQSAVGKFLLEYSSEEEVRGVAELGVDPTVLIYQNKKITKKGATRSGTNQT
ncbi:2-phosphosulfolactate phosphatase [Bacillus sp. FJAT-45037]|uniref:2-phosphosulfolactate phosphatase n=1 Tax=Bacillus sp. FJAT-45037 TaxID=2011007 RepID=UPI0012FE220D|nr:2-phosphosulfolactate phosphatase [Bacillus sp. FJAT-45037]